jgi:hypothetical protein
MMGDANLGEGVEFFILTSPGSLHGNNFTINKSLNKSLEFLEFLEDLVLVFWEVDPSKFAKIVNETHIIFKSSNDLWCRPPYI